VALAALDLSIRTNGLATPVEVLPTDGPVAFALVASYRRMAALRRLVAAGVTRFATAPRTDRPRHNPAPGPGPHGRGERHPRRHLAPGQLERFASDRIRDSRSGCPVIPCL
jgi:hypothetical protein